MVLLPAILLLVLVLTGGAFVAYRYPLELLARRRRKVLAKVAERRWMDGPGGRLVYRVVGRGRPVIFLHGAGDQGGTWGEVVRRLMDRGEEPPLRCIVPDLPGHGESGPRSGPLSLEDGLRGLDALMEAEVGEAEAVLVGNSMGGWIALLYAHRHPHRVARLVLENAGGVESLEVSLQPQDRRQAAKLMAAVLGPDGREPPGFVLDNLVRRTRKGPIARLAASSSEPLLLGERLSEIHVPATVIWGEDDGILPLAQGRRLAQEIAGSELVVLPRCGHVPHLECPDRFVPALEEALARASASEAGLGG